MHRCWWSGAPVCRHPHRHTRPARSRVHLALILRGTMHGGTGPGGLKPTVAMVELQMDVSGLPFTVYR